MNAEPAVVLLRVFAAALLLAGCRTQPGATDGAKPSARLIDMTIAEPGLDYVTLRFDVEVENPYPAELPIGSLYYSISSGAHTFLSATPISETRIAAGARQVVSIPAKVVYKRLLEALAAKPGSQVPFTARLWLWVDMPDVGPARIRAEGQGAMALPLEPQVSAGDKVVGSVDVVFVATPHDVVSRMLALAEVKKDDLVYDLGCGDGRIVVAAAKTYGCRAVGFDVDPHRVAESKQSAARNGVEHLVTIEQRDIFTLDLSKADVVTLYLLPELNVRLIPQLVKLKRGARVVSHNFAMEGVEPDKVVTVLSREDSVEHTLYLWVAPLKVGVAAGSLEMTQGEAAPPWPPYVRP